MKRFDRFDIDEEPLHKEFDISSADRKIWLVKVPEFLHEKWRNWDNESLEMGKVNVYPG
jgi:hypothetical protein